MIKQFPNIQSSKLPIRKYKKKDIVRNQSVFYYNINEHDYESIMHSGYLFSFDITEYTDITKQYKFKTCNEEIEKCIVDYINKWSQEAHLANYISKSCFVRTEHPHFILKEIDCEVFESYLNMNIVDLTESLTSEQQHEYINKLADLSNVIEGMPGFTKKICVYTSCLIWSAQ